MESTGGHQAKQCRFMSETHAGYQRPGPRIRLPQEVSYATVLRRPKFGSSRSQRRARASKAPKKLLSSRFAEKNCRLTQGPV